MPPKKSNKEAKALEKKKLKLVEDSTFGMKNKNKSKQLQKKIEQMKNQVVYGNRSNAEKAREERLKAEKKAEKERQEALNKLLRATVMTQKVKPGVDTKSIVCEFFKRGLCTKGNKCKFSHDLTIERRAAKRSIYGDDEEEKKKKETSENWDQSTLEKVVEQKHGAKNRGLPPTTIVCKYFLDAVEKGLYGWFWQCPNGEKCHYRHCLPPGFVLKKKGAEEKKDEEEGPPLEEVLEQERKLLVGGTPVTLESFMAWKQKKIAEKEEKAKQERKEKEAKAADSKGRMNVGMSGRDLFAYNPDMFEDDEDAAQNEIDYTHREEENEEENNNNNNNENINNNNINNNNDGQEGASSSSSALNEEDEESDLDEEELKKRYAITSTGPIDSSLFADDAALEGLDDDDDDEKEEEKEKEKEKEEEKDE